MPVCVPNDQNLRGSVNVHLLDVRTWILLKLMCRSVLSLYFPDAFLLLYHIVRPCHKLLLNYDCVVIHLASTFLVNQEIILFSLLESPSRVICWCNGQVKRFINQNNTNTKINETFTYRYSWMKTINYSRHFPKPARVIIFFGSLANCLDLGTFFLTRSI